MKLFDVYPINPINIVKGVGSLVYDDKGTEYLDLYGGHAVISIGHTHPHYVKRLEDQLHRIRVYFAFVGCMFMQFNQLIVLFCIISCTLLLLYISSLAQVKHWSLYWTSQLHYLDNTYCLRYK